MNINCRAMLLMAVLGVIANGPGRAQAEVCNLKIVTDASPDYSDIPSLVHSVTARWESPREKCWAMFYWNHIARRQTSPMILHGLELTDPIRQFNDYGYTMCSTIAGLNCALWHHLGYKSRFWDISLHTVSEVFYDGRWHMYDNSMSALYTLCDGQTLAGVEDIGKDGACALSNGRTERGHVAKYHCLYSTGPNGFLTGADTQRSLEEEARCFNPNGLKFRPYYFNWDYGHRYILNLRPGDIYTRYYHRRGTNAEFYVPNHGKDPDDRYRIRGNGLWQFRPDLTDASGLEETHSTQNIVVGPAGLKLANTQRPGEVIFKVQAGNVITSQQIQLAFAAGTIATGISLSISRNNGLSWTRVWEPRTPTDTTANVKVIQAVNGAYETIMRVSIPPGPPPGSPVLERFDVDTSTMLNAKTQPRLNLGRNTVYVDAGPQTESVVFWPELQKGGYKEHIVEEKNVRSVREHPGYQGVVHPEKPGQDAYLVYRMDAPTDITQVTFGGRFYNRAPQSQISLLHSLDGGQTWSNSWSLRRISQPWDAIHYETVPVPAGHRSVWLKYLMRTTDASPAGCGIYAIRLEANHRPVDSSFKPVQVTFSWSERQNDRSLVERSHTLTVHRLPCKYHIHVGGADHPVVNSLRISLQGAATGLRDGYSDGQDVGGEKFTPTWLTCGRNLAIGKRYELSQPSATNWDAGDDGKKLTSGAGGPSYAGGTSYRSAALWMEKLNPVITIDLEKEMSCASFGLNLHGYPWWDALQGEVKDEVEVLTSCDGTDYVSQGFLKSDLRWADLPANFMWTDDETMTSATFRCTPGTPVRARYVKFQIRNKRIIACAGIEVLDAIKLEPFDLRLALPDEAGPVRSYAPTDDGS